MRVGFQTILWGWEFEDLDASLRVLQHFHFKGIEVFQAPCHLPNVRDFAKMLQDYDLELVGMAGGKVEDRLRYCGGVLRPKYLYVETFDQNDANMAASEGVPLALHPHVFAPIHRLSAALKELEQHAALKFLPDTAHLAIAGDDPVDAVRRGGSRLAAVHLQDWTPIYGRSVHRYAKGFTELGKGTLTTQIDGTINELRRQSYDGWLIVEQDSSVLPAEVALQVSADWLAHEKRRLLPKASPLPASGGHVREPKFDRVPGLELTDFLRRLANVAVTSGDRFYEQMAAEFGRLIPCRFVSIWSYSPKHDTLGHLAYFPNELLLDLDVSLERSKSLSKPALESRRPEVFDLKANAELPIALPELIKQMNPEELWTLPVLNCNSPNQVRFLVNFSPQERLDPGAWRAGLAQLAVDLGRAADVALEERCSYAAASISILDRQQESGRFLQNLAKEIARLTHSQGCSIFLESEAGDRLECAGSTGIEWNVPENRRYYTRGLGLTGKCWEMEESLIVNHACAAENWKGLSTETVTERLRDSVVFVPLKLPQGEAGSSKFTVIGVVRCRTKERPNYFYSDDDVAVLDAIVQAALPYLTALLDEERRIRALKRLTHELRTPLVAISGALDLMEGDLERYFGGKAPNIFEEDYLQDAFSWKLLMDRLLDNADLVSGRNGRIEIQPEPTLILKDVLAAAILQADRLRARRNLRSGISHGGFEQIPRLYVDRNLFQQTFFNLLSNSVKYAYMDSNAFTVEVLAQRVSNGFEIRFRDWGTGIDGNTEKIFEFGIRGRDRTGRNVAGQGIGLWAVRRVVVAHGGRVWVSSTSQPTEFTIFLPADLQYSAPAGGTRKR